MHIFLHACGGYPSVMFHRCGVCCTVNMMRTSLGVKKFGPVLGGVLLHEVSGVPHELPAVSEDRDRPRRGGRGA